MRVIRWVVLGVLFFASYGQSIHKHTASHHAEDSDYNESTTSNSFTSDALNSSLSNSIQPTRILHIQTHQQLSSSPIRYEKYNKTHAQLVNKCQDDHELRELVHAPGIEY